MGLSAANARYMMDNNITGDQNNKFKELQQNIIKELGGKEYTENAGAYNAIMRVLMKDKGATLEDVKDFKQQLDFMKEQRHITNTTEILTNFDKMLRSNKDYAKSDINAKELLDMFANYASGCFPSTCESFEDYVSKTLRGELRNIENNPTTDASDGANRDLKDLPIVIPSDLDIPRGIPQADPPRIGGPRGDIKILDAMEQLSKQSFIARDIFKNEE